MHRFTVLKPRSRFLSQLVSGLILVLVFGSPALVAQDPHSIIDEIQALPYDYDRTPLVPRVRLQDRRGNQVLESSCGTRPVDAVE